ncbi:MAG: Zn-dependent protease [Pseudobdellovibrio sp.]|jgi:predicted Zn-dependent protease|nr:Zn-dependent protease [Pseudobdellovibrio sp.]
MQTYLKSLSEKLFNELKGNEELSIGLHSEESEFVRFNHSLVRQNTHVHQHEATFQFQNDGRTYAKTATLTLDPETDLALGRDTITEMRAVLPLIDPSPKYTPMVNNGTSEVFQKSERPPVEKVINHITDVFSKSDLAGFYCAGPLRQASLNSKGQSHYFENDSFFFDYSVYDGPRAAKGYYADSQWDEARFDKQASQAKNTLSLLAKPQIKVKPGAYRTYLAPMAVAEIAEIFNWRAVSRSQYEQGFTPLKKLFTREQLFSPHFSLIENNSLGLNSHFNTIGEISPSVLPIIENGEMKNFLINSATAKEYNLVSNNADAGMWSSEVMRSMEIRAGTLADEQILKELGTGLYLTNLHYINWSDPQAARLTGMTRFACFWVENGEIAGPIQDLRFDDSLYNIFGTELAALTKDRSRFTNTLTYQKRRLGGMMVPGALLNKMNFTL